MIAHAVTVRKLRNSQAIAKAGTTELVVGKTSMTAQLVSRMLAFFGLKSKTAGAARQLGETT
jgi:hypothetical protein